jgi:N-acetylmuramoyl-L-alanine amidase
VTRLPAIDQPSPNHAARPEPARIDMLVLHYTGMITAAAALERLCDPDARVSAHYVVEENGVIRQLVPETRRAFHAGVSCWAGESDLNAVSLGIEIVRHPIPPHRVVGHSDIAPERKSDPGELFDWARLARAGIGIWPLPQPAGQDVIISPAGALADLASIGYCARPESQTAALVAFQRRFRQSCCDGRLDAETAARLSQVRDAFARSRAASLIGRS